MVHYSNSILAGLAAAFLAVLALGTLWTNDEAARITSISIGYSITYLFYFVALWIASRVPESPHFKKVVVLAAISFRLLAFTLPPSLSDDYLRYQWEAKTLSAGLNPYLTSPAQLADPDHRIPGYDFSAVYGPVLESAHWLNYQTGLPMKTSASLAEALLLLLAWRQRWPVWRWMILAWSPLSVYEYWMNGHSDSWIMLLLFSALLTKGTATWIWLAFATLTKWWPVLLVPLWIGQRFSAPGLLAYAVLLSGCLLLMPISEWITKVRFTTGFLGGWQNNAFLYRFLTDKMQAIGISGFTSAVLPLLKLGPAESILCFLTVFLAFSANIHLWYLGWLLPFLAASRWGPLPWLLPMALLPLAYDSMIGWRLSGSWQEDELMRVWIWSGVLVFSGYSFFSKRNG